MKGGEQLKEFFSLLKQGNKSALMAAIVNTFISILKGVGYLFTGNVAMFAETLHSVGDAANQFFVFIGSALSKKAPTDRFPNGFGRLVNLVLLGAVLIVGIMSFETIREGFHHIFHPTESKGFLISVSILTIAIILESFVLVKAMKEVLHEVGVKATGLSFIPKSITNIGKAKAATKLVLLEDAVATGGGILALAAVIISHFTNFHQAEGIASILIGISMFIVVGKVFMDNAAGALGEADEEMEVHLGNIIMSDPDVLDIKEIIVLKEGDSVHVDVEVEVNQNLTVVQTDDIRQRLIRKILNEKGVSDIAISFNQDDKVKSWIESIAINPSTK